MTVLIANWLFDLGGLIGALIIAWPLIFIKHDSVRRNVSVSGLSNRDKEELIPQIKLSQAGALILVLTVIGKLVYLTFIEFNWPTGNPAIIAFLVMGVIAAMAVLLRICLIDHYWAKYEFRKED